MQGLILIFKKLWKLFLNIFKKKNMPGIDSNTLLLLHGDGSNGGQTFTDSSFYNRTATVAGDIITSTADKKFGVSSIYNSTLSGGHKITFPTSTDFDIWDGDATIECWVNPLNALYNRAFRVVERGIANPTYLIWQFGITSDKPSLIFTYRITPTYDFFGVQATNTFTFSAGAWHHIAIVRSSGTFLMFIDGVSVEVTTQGTYQTGKAFTGLLYVGYSLNSNGSIEGYVDELRISNKARWISDFTPPQMAYDSNTDNMIATD